MAPDLRENQLELFDLGRQQPARMSRESLGRVFLQFRHDQLVLGSIAGLLGLTVVFACGVERGKQLVRSERVLIARQQQALERVPAEPKREASAPVIQAAPAVPAVITAPAPVKAPATPAAPAAPAKKEKTKVADAAKPKAKTGSSRYAVQVVTYTQPQLARQEMERLRAKGEPVFLLMRDGRTIVYVGPFPSKTNASERLGRLRARYQDCFIKSL
jgi:cell division septation protein DedD